MGIFSLCQHWVLVQIIQGKNKENLMERAVKSGRMFCLQAVSLQLLNVQASINNFHHVFICSLV